MRCWCGYLSGARCRLFAHCPADATASPNRIFSCLIQIQAAWFYLSCTSLPRLSAKSSSVATGDTCPLTPARPSHGNCRKPRIKNWGGEVGYRIILAKHGDEVRINVVEGYKHKILYRPTGWAKKWGHRLMTINLSNLNRFKRKI